MLSRQSSFASKGVRINLTKAYKLGSAVGCTPLVVGARLTPSNMPLPSCYPA